MQSGPPRPRRARPVTDAPIDALCSRLDDLAKGWLVALIEQAPLDQASAIHTGDLASNGPRVCEAVLRALVDDVALRRIEPGGALEQLVSETGELAGAEDAEGAVRAVGTLQAVIWSALRDALSDPNPDQVAELAERLALVTEQVRGATVRGYIESTPQWEAPEPSGAIDQPTDDALWMRALDEEITRSHSARVALALLLVELEEADRMRAVDAAVEGAGPFGRFAQAVRTALRRHDILACETHTRAWIVARDTMRPGARALGARVASAVRAEEPWRGAPLTVSVGVAVLGEDGRDRRSMMEAAEQDRFAAAAAGISVVHAVGPEAGGDPPQPGPPGIAG
jgi:GGDEF domain-containing protein